MRSAAERAGQCPALPVPERRTGVRRQPPRKPALQATPAQSRGGFRIWRSFWTAHAAAPLVGGGHTAAGSSPSKSAGGPAQSKTLRDRGDHEPGPTWAARSIRTPRRRVGARGLKNLRVFATLVGVLLPAGPVVRTGSKSFPEHNGGGLPSAATGPVLARVAPVGVKPGPILASVAPVFVNLVPVFAKTAPVKANIAPV